MSTTLKKENLLKLRESLTNDTDTLFTNGDCKPGEFIKPTRSCCQLGYFDKKPPRPTVEPKI